MRIVWFRRDLRLSDNDALDAAVRSGEPVTCVYVHGPSWPTGRASRAWLACSLEALGGSLRARGADLLELSGDPASALARLATDLAATYVHCSRVWTPGGLAEERSAAAALSHAGIPLHVSEGQLLAVPDSVRTSDGRPFAVFTPFHRAWRTAWRPETPLPAPKRIPVSREAATPPLLSSTSPARVPGSVASTASPATHHPVPPDETARVRRWWTPGERGAEERLAAFIADGVERYDATRDLPAARGTSELSPHLAFGEISPRRVVASLLDVYDESVAAPFIRQLAWREFAAHVLLAHPETATRPLRPEFDEFEWRDDQESLERWKAGLTGFPLVDAGMRQLAETGWMHNRARLVCGSFLTKDLLVSWRLGEELFREALVDHDPASNIFNWQWVAGCGADAAPYFRIFNPSLQAARFDPDGAYVRRWVPEIETGAYPEPMVDHAAARARALAAYGAIERGAIDRR